MVTFLKRYPTLFLVTLEAVIWRHSVKKGFLKISQNLQENTFTASLFNKIVGVRPATLLKSDSSKGVFL